MRSRKSRFALIGVSALALGAFAGPGIAQAAKVSEKADGGLVPAEINPAVGPTVSVPFVQTFKLKGKNVTKKQILDVNVTVNGFGNGAFSNSDLSARLIGPKRNSSFLHLPGIGSAMVNLENDDQSVLNDCNPLTFQSDDCNYLQGGSANGSTGTMTGELEGFLNPVFKGGNPKGTWRLVWRDNNDDVVTTTLGETTLEVKTGKKFAKE